MAFNKIALSPEKNMKVEPLNDPHWDIYEISNNIKTATSKKADIDKLGGFDLEAELEKHPDFLYIKIFAIEKDEVNDNGDSFSESELKLAADTFIGVPLFTNHQNTDIEKAKGECVHSWYDDDEGGIYLIARVDKVAYPRLARGIEEQYLSGTSMGCSVNYSVCSICHNRAAVAEHYCSHVKERKNRIHSGTEKCAYHDSPDQDPEEKPCPLCGCKHGESKEVVHKGQKVFEHNYGLKFIENSFVVNPACHRCGICDILHAPLVTTKIAKINKDLKTFAKHPDINSFFAMQKAASSQAKNAGQNELSKLINSMGEIEVVVKSMLAQKEQVSMEYVSDLVKVMADVQGVVDELTEMGYAQLSSPEGTETTAEVAETGQPVAPPQPQLTGKTVNTMPSGHIMENIDGVGTVIKPKFSSVSDNKKKELLTKHSNLTSRVLAIRDRVQKISENRSENMANTLIEVSSDSSERRVLIDKTNEDIYVTEAEGENVIKVSHISEFTNEMQEFIKANPQNAAQHILANKELDKTMANKQEQKSAAVGNPSSDTSTQQEVITEKQLGDLDDNASLHPRTDETWEQITEAEVEGDKDQKELDDTTGESPQTRWGTYEVITEGQLASISDGHIARWKDWPEVITEKQWTDFSRWASAKLPDDWKETITEDQLKTLLSSHRFVGTYEVITEGQFKDQDYGIKRWASKEYSTQVMKIATQSISDAVARFHKSPKEIKNAVAVAQDQMDKVAFLTLINSLPHKAEDIRNLESNIDYFKKVASATNSPTNVDALILSVAKNGTHGIKVEDVYDAVQYAFNSEMAMAQVVEQVQEKLAETDIDNSIVDKYAAFKNAVEELDKPEDGMYKIQATIEDIGADPKTSKKAFVEAARAFTQKQAGNTIVLEITQNDDGTIEIIAKDSEMVTDDEIAITDDTLIDGLGPCDEVIDVIDEEEFSDEDIIEDEEGEESKPATGNVGGAGGAGGMGGMGGMGGTSIASKREAINKEAQMMGGQMGDQGGASQAPGAGASLPTPPGAMNQMAPMESFTGQGPGAEEMDTDEDLEAKPPGSMCVVCGSGDVDVVAGKGQCNNCGSEMQFKISVDVTRWANLTPDDGKEDGGEDGFGEGEGFEMPGEEGLEMGAMVRLQPGSLSKIATKTVLGSISPANGSANTVDLGKNQWYCVDTGTHYKVAYAVDAKTKIPYAQWEWKARTPGSHCPSCTRQKLAFVNALKTHGVSEEEFDQFDIQKKAEAIIAMKEAGLLKNVKTAATEETVIKEFQASYGGFGNSFPMERCLQKLANRFGENAVALSGPCEGKPLAECVCKSLKQAKVYSTGLAVKVAEAWEDQNGTECCIEDQIRLGRNIRQASEICAAFKTALASPEDIFAEKFAQGFMDDIDQSNVEIEEEEEEVDPFDGDDIGLGEDLGEDLGDDVVGDEGGTITVELSEDLAKELDAELDVALGSDPVDDLGPGDEDIAEEVGVGDELGDDIAVDGPSVPEEKSMEEGEGYPADEGETLHTNEDTGSNSVTIRLQESDYDIKEAEHMRGDIGKTNRIEMDLSGVSEVLSKSAEEKEIQHENVQDSEDLDISAGNPADGGHSSAVMHEEEAIQEATKPTVPRDKALIGQEDSDSNPQDKPQPKIPSDKGTMGHEDEAGLSGGDARYTGGDDGAGAANTASVNEDGWTQADIEVAEMSGFGNQKDRLARLAQRVLEAQSKKLEPKKPVADDEDIKPIQDKGVMGHEPKFDPDTPTNTESSNSHMGHEKESLGDKPTSPDDHPEIPADNALMGHEEKSEVGPEKQTRNKGTVIAESDRESEVHVESQQLAFRVAGTMLQKGLIEASQLETKITELAKYEPAQIRDFESMVLKSVIENKKGFTTASRGLEQPLVINEASSHRNANDELQTKLASLFTLSARNQEADSNPDASWRQAYKNR